MRFSVVIIITLSIFTFSSTDAQSCAKHFTDSLYKTTPQSSTPLPFTIAQQTINEFTTSSLIAEIMWVQMQAYFAGKYAFKNVIDPNYIFHKGNEVYKEEVIDLILSNKFDEFIFDDGRQSHMTQDTDLNTMISELLTAYAKLNVHVIKNFYNTFKLDDKNVNTMSLQQAINHLSSHLKPSISRFIQNIFIEIAFRKYLEVDPHLEKYDTTFFSLSTDSDLSLSNLSAEIIASFGSIYEFNKRVDAKIRKEAGIRKPGYKYSDEKLIEETVSLDVIQGLNNIFSKNEDFVDLKHVYNQNYALTKNEYNTLRSATRQRFTLDELNLKRFVLIMNKIMVRELEPDYKLIAESRLDHDILRERKRFIQLIASTMLNIGDVNNPFGHLVTYTELEDGISILKPQDLPKVEKLFSSFASYATMLRDELNKSPRGSDIIIRRREYVSWELEIKFQEKYTIMGLTEPRF